MNRIILAGALSCSLGLGGCGTITAISSGTTPSATVVSQDLADLTKTVGALTAAACAFQPDEVAIAAIVSAGDPSIATANAIASIVCKAVDARVFQSRRGLIVGGPVILPPTKLPNGKKVVISGAFTS